MSKFDHRGRLHSKARHVHHAPADIQHQGRVAFLNELTQGDNPYPTGTPDFRAWETGFLFEFSKHYFGQNKGPVERGA